MLNLVYIIVTQDQNVYKLFVEMDKDINHPYINIMKKQLRFLF